MVEAQITIKANNLKKLGSTIANSSIETSPSVRNSSVFVDLQDLKALPEYNDLNRMNNSLYKEKFVYFRRSFENSRLFNTTTSFERKKRRLVNLEAEKRFDQSPESSRIDDNTDITFKEKIFSKTKTQLHRAYMKIGKCSKDLPFSPFNEEVRQSYLDRFIEDRLQNEESKTAQKLEKLQRSAKEEIMDGQAVVVTTQEAYDNAVMSAEDHTKFQNTISQAVTQQMVEVALETAKARAASLQPIDEEAEAASPRTKKRAGKKEKGSIRHSGEQMSLLDQIKAEVMKKNKERSKEEEMEYKKKMKEENQQQIQEERATDTKKYKNNLISKRQFANIFTGRWIDNKNKRPDDNGIREHILYQSIDKFIPKNASDSNQTGVLQIGETPANEKALEHRTKLIEKEQRAILKVVRLCTPVDRDVINETKPQFKKDLLKLNAVPLSFKADAAKEKEKRETTSTISTPMSNNRRGTAGTSRRIRYGTVSPLFKTELKADDRDQSKGRTPRTANCSLEQSKVIPKVELSFDGLATPSNLPHLRRTTIFTGAAEGTSPLRNNIMANREKVEINNMRRNSLIGGNLINGLAIGLSPDGHSPNIIDEKIWRRHKKQNLTINNIYEECDQLQGRLYEPINRRKKVASRIHRRYDDINDRLAVIRYEADHLE